MSDNKQSRVMTSEEHGKVSAAVAVLFAIFAKAEWDTNGKGETVSEGDTVRTLVRAAAALEAYEAEKNAARDKAAMVGIQGILKAKREETITGYVEMARQLKAAPMFKSMLAAKGVSTEPPQWFDIPVSSLVEFFPGHNEAQVVKVLHEKPFGMKLAPGGKGRDSKLVRVGISAETWKEALAEV
jgi:hypothetical protein